MKKNILKATIVAAFALIAGFNVYNVQKSDIMPELALANVEALANPEVEIAFCITTSSRCKGIGIEDVEGYRQY